MGRLKDTLIDQMDTEHTNEVFIDNNFSKFHRNNLNVFHLIVQYADESAKKRIIFEFSDQAGKLIFI